MKKCSKCLMEKSETDFYARSLRCKKCCIELQKVWAAEHPEQVKKYMEKFKKEKPEQYRASKRKYFEKNREMLNEKSNEWRKSHREYWNQYIREFKQKNPNYMLSEKLRGRVRSALSGTPRSADLQTLLGCDYVSFRKYIESKFLPGMTWQNFGEWHIDHIRPCASFDLTNPAEQAKCFHFSNTQPLWAKDNLKKYSHWK